MDSDIQELLTSEKEDGPLSPSSTSHALASPSPDLLTNSQNPPLSTTFVPTSPVDQRHASVQKVRAKNLGKSRRKRRRQQGKEQYKLVNPVRVNTLTKYAKSEVVPTLVQAETFKVASSGFIASKSLPSQQVFLPTQLVGPSSSNFRLVAWPGNVSKPILDHSGRVIAVCASQPQGDSWLQVVDRATELIQKAGSRGKFTVGQAHHSRGQFPTLATGFAHGGGRLAPMNHRPTNAVNAALVDELLHDPAFERIATMQSSTCNYSLYAHFLNNSAGIFAHWAPRLHAYYSQTITKICEHDRSLRRNWDNSVFASAVFNLGPQTICRRHRDFANLSFGWCAITALGTFNPIAGGHLVLWDLGLLIEFPPGSTVLMPSAVVEHSNTPIQEGDTRFSFTQYTAGGLFRWVERGMKSEKAFSSGSTTEQLEANKLKDANRWKIGLTLYATEAEIKSNGRKEQ